MINCVILQDDFKTLAVLTNPNDSAVRVCQLSADGHWMIAAGDADQAFVWNIDAFTLTRYNHNIFPI